jgi:L-asparagine transporter-like permease
MGTLKIFGRLGGVLALILLIVALLRQLVALVGFLLAAVKVAVVLMFIGIVVLILLAIFRDRAQRRRESQEL